MFSRVLLVLAALPAGLAAQSMLRPPAVPLIAHDPYFSLWSMGDELNGSPTQHWTGERQDLSSLVRIDRRAYRLIGTDPRFLLDQPDTPALAQTGREVWPTRTIYTRWVREADDGDRYRLAFDRPGTWSQKYNLFWDRILGLDLFPPAVAEKEVAFYLKTQNACGLPLGNRSQFTKIDWIFWSAALASREDDFRTLVSPVWRFLNETPDRSPMTDWYWTHDARRRGFTARSVVGGVYIKMLADPALWRKWASRAQ